MDWKKLENINKNLETLDVKGKGYVEVNKRVIAFRELEPNGSIQTEIVSLENGVVTIKAVIMGEDGNVLSTGYAQEKETSSFINKTSFIENCETSAVGRALGFCGIGVDASIASAEEVANAINNQNKKPNSKASKEPANKELTKEEIAGLVITLCDKKRFDVKDICSKSGVENLEDMTSVQLSKWVDWLESK